VNPKALVAVGGGIIGCSIALELATTGRTAILTEKEKDLAVRQTGRNSGLTRASPYYKPGSLKAQLCNEGNRSLVNLAKKQNIYRSHRQATARDKT
jgi:(S)-2-hydroxyglutarate dehydrogenase